MSGSKEHSLINACIWGGQILNCGFHYTSLLKANSLRKGHFVGGAQKSLGINAVSENQVGLFLSGTLAHQSPYKFLIGL